jgi:hypothetical protein
VSVAKWDGNKIVITRTQQMGDQSVQISETWAMEGGNLTIASTGGRGGARSGFTRRAEPVAGSRQ